jgi:hypothetical protein
MSVYLNMPAKFRVAVRQKERSLSQFAIQTTTGSYYPEMNITPKKLDTERGREWGYKTKNAYRKKKTNVTLIK